MLHRPLGNTGIEVSRIAFGAASLGEEYERLDPTEALKLVPHAIDAGIDFLDTSPYYGRGRSEVMLGYALRGIPRDRYRICTKLGRYDTDKFDFSARRVTESVDVSLKRLGLEHLDVVLCHDVEYVDPTVVVEEAIPRLRELQREGKVGAVGMSAYPMKVFRTVLDQTDLDVILSYASLTLHNRTLESLLPLCRERGIGVIDAAPFDMRILTDAPLPDWHPAPPELRAVAAEARALCHARGASLAKLAFQFAIAQEGPATTVIGTSSPSEIDQWIRWMDDPIDRDLLAEVERVFTPVRDRPRIMGLPENN